MYVIPGEAALLWPGAAISSHLRFCLKGSFWEDTSFITREDLPQGECETSCLLFLLPALFLSHFLHTFPFWGVVMP